MTCFLKNSIIQKVYVVASGSNIISLIWKLYLIGITSQTLIILPVFAHPSLRNRTIIDIEKDKSTRQYCDSQKTFTNEQKQFCYYNIELVKVFIDGFKLGVKECQVTFKDSGKTNTRWNCTNLANEKRDNVFFGIPQAKGLSSCLLKNLYIAIYIE